MKKIVLVLGVLVCISCFTDSDDFNNDKILKAQLLRNVILDDVLLYTIDYYPDGKMMSQTNFSGGAISHYAFLEYENDTVYKTISGIFSTKTKSYQANSNTIVSLEFNNEDQLLFYYFNNYSSSNCGLTKSETFTRFGQLYTTRTYNYTDLNCSYNSNIELFNGEQKNNYSILKDDKNNYYKSLNVWPSFEVKHNIIEFRKWDANDNLVLNNCYNSVFEYDQNDYPIVETRTYLSGETKVYQFEYY